MSFPASEIPQTEVELSISARGLKNRDLASKSDPVAVLFTQDFGGGAWHERERSEVIMNCLDPAWAHRFAIQYRFEERQLIRLEIYDVDSQAAALSAHDFLGRVELSLGEAVGAGRLEKRLEGGSGTIVIAAEAVEGSKEVAVMQWRGEKLDKKDFLGKSDPFLVFYRLNDDRSSTVVFRSDYIKKTLNPTWRGFQIPLRLLCKGDKARHFRVECYDYDNDGGHDLIGLFETTIAELESGAKKAFPLINPKKAGSKKGYKDSGTLHLMSFALVHHHSFLDFIRGGTQLHFTVAVDFTASNGHPAQPASLHYIHPSQPNQYMLAMKAVGEIIADYDADKMFPALGFGGKLPSGQVSHEFFLNGHPQDPHCAGVDGVLDAYKRALHSVSLYGPTCFQPVIEHVARIAAGAGQDGRHYFVLLILTDGIITDFAATLDSVVRSSALPMSIIIVGVGNDDFAAMDQLDGDGQRPEAGDIAAESEVPVSRLSSNGRWAERDIVQFVPFRQYMNPGVPPGASKARLAQDVLKEVPDQLTQWMQARNIQPPALRPS